MFWAWVAIGAQSAGLFRDSSCRCVRRDRGAGRSVWRPAARLQPGQEASFRAVLPCICLNLWNRFPHQTAMLCGLALKIAVSEDPTPDEIAWMSTSIDAPDVFVSEWRICPGIPGIVDHTSTPVTALSVATFTCAKGVHHTPTHAEFQELLEHSLLCAASLVCHFLPPCSFRSGVSKPNTENKIREGEWTLT